MAYVAVKGGEAAISAAHSWLAEARRGARDVPALELAQIKEQLSRAVDRVMAEGALYDRDLAALAIAQAQGDLIEAAFLLRAYRTTLPRLIDTDPVDTGAMLISRRVSAIFKDLPGGQRLGPTTDYTHRLLDFSLETAGAAPAPVPAAAVESIEKMPRVTDLLGAESLIENDPSGDETPRDLTMEPVEHPAPRDVRLQGLARGDEGFLLALGYSTQRGYGQNHPFVGELRVGEVPVSIVPPELGFAIEIGDVMLTECQMVNQFGGSKTAPPQFTRGYGLCFGHADRKAMAMSLVDRAMRAAELGEDASAPAQSVEFVLSHCDNIEATGFVEHLKLPHHVDFQSELETIRAMRAEARETLKRAEALGALKRDETKRESETP
ncbi:MAG TPA: carbon-phosphorus lyase complex subunit PhnI [Acidocella sp.]|jgi:alpha-D-ribose 1-methylphosphonate 5-triphosphate synthase subunit PhnI|uniref:carbon-phosphorus lyase complex subunit PhnI n=1 Tax=Acidocella sp. TaxID=50710 RepID=UPI002B6C29BA|nr:carbon-phosphorus lyase complex subunit PhnI [Acidocella sp.]HVE22818.1 carbon-phosphorus lyase complex subunit PhnI [Acidocella sp.]